MSELKELQDLIDENTKEQYDKGLKEWIDSVHNHLGVNLSERSLPKNKIINHLEQEYRRSDTINLYSFIKFLMILHWEANKNTLCKRARFKAVNDLRGLARMAYDVMGGRP